jgi:hypothetical protein
VLQHVVLCCNTSCCAATRRAVLQHVVLHCGKELLWRMRLRLQIRPHSRHMDRLAGVPPPHLRTPQDPQQQVATSHAMLQQFDGMLQL